MPLFISGLLRFGRVAAQGIPHVVVGINGAHGTNIHVLSIVAVGVNRGKKYAGRIGDRHRFRAGCISTAATYREQQRHQGYCCQLPHV